MELTPLSTAEIFLIIVVAVPLLLAACNRLRLDLAALSIAAILGTAHFFGMGLFGPADTPNLTVRAISGLGQPIILTLMGLFIITRGLDNSGVTRWIVKQVLKIGGQSEKRLIILFAGTTALLSLVMNNLAAGALLLPSAVEVCRRTGIKPSKLLIPVAFGSMLGGAATYFTTANIIVSGLLPIAEPAQQALNILDFTPTGGLIAIAGILYLGFWGRRLLPDRNPPSDVLFARPTGSELEDYYHLEERMWEVRILPKSPFVGQSLAVTGIGAELGITVMAVWRASQAIFAPGPQFCLQANDILLVIGREELVSQLEGYYLTIGRNGSHQQISLRGVSMIEIMLPPHSRAEGRTLKQLDFRRLYGFTAVALWRKGRSYRSNIGDFKLELGDTLLMVGMDEQLRALARNPDYIVMEASKSDQPVERKSARVTTLALLAAIAVSIAGFPVYLAMLAGALVILMAGVLTIDEAYRSIEWQAIFLIAGMYAASLAMVETGLANHIGALMLRIVEPLGPLGLAAGSFWLSGLLTQIMGGQVTALVTGPAAISAAIHMGTSPQAIAVAAGIGCSAVFLTPLAHPVNVLMISPANYRFSDFFKLGLPLNLLVIVLGTLLIPRFWPF